MGSKKWPIFAYDSTDWLREMPWEGGGGEKSRTFCIRTGTYWMDAPKKNYSKSTLVCLCGMLTNCYVFSRLRWWEFLSKFKLSKFWLGSNEMERLGQRLLEVKLNCAIQETRLRYTLVNSARRDLFVGLFDKLYRKPFMNLILNRILQLTRQ